MKVTNVREEKKLDSKFQELNSNPALAMENYLLNFCVPDFVLHAKV